MTTNGPRASRRPAGEDDVVARVHARRERHRRRPLAVRALAVIAGGLLAAIGVVLLVPLPEAGVPALLAGLGLLALEFDWAAAALIRVERAWQRFKRLPLAARTAVLVVLAVILVGSLLLAF